MGDPGVHTKMHKGRIVAEEPWSSILMKHWSVWFGRTIETNPLKNSGLLCRLSARMPSHHRLEGTEPKSTRTTRISCSAGESDLFVACRVLRQRCAGQIVVDGRQWHDLRGGVLIENTPIVLQVIASSWLPSVGCLRFFGQCRGVRTVAQGYLSV